MTADAKILPVNFSIRFRDKSIKSQLFGSKNARFSIESMLELGATNVLTFFRRRFEKNLSGRVCKLEPTKLMTMIDSGAKDVRDRVVLISLKDSTPSIVQLKRFEVEKGLQLIFGFSDVTTANTTQKRHKSFLWNIFWNSAGELTILV
jgi:hypothetical protein